MTTLEEDGEAYEKAHPVPWFWEVGYEPHDKPLSPEASVRLIDRVVSQMKAHMLKHRIGLSRDVWAKLSIRWWAGVPGVDLPSHPHCRATVSLVLLPTEKESEWVHFLVPHTPPKS